MRRPLAMLGTLLAILVPLGASAQDRPNAISAGIGYYFYTGDVEDRTDLDGAVNIEAAYTRQLHPNFALRAGTGYFHDGRLGDDLRGYPLTLTALGVYPAGRLRLFAGGGVGVYFVDFEGKVDGTPIDDSDTIWGGHVLVGTSFDVTTTIFLGLEAKYLFLDSARLGSRELDLDGVTVTATVGFRF